MHEQGEKRKKLPMPGKRLPKTWNMLRMYCISQKQQAMAKNGMYEIKM
jgi:hypothetical protein